MICPSCQEPNSDEAEACFTCGMALHALTQGAVLAGRYVIRQPLGRGGMGHVYRAYDRILEEDVAIKVIRAELVREPEMARRFRSETRLARKVSHPNVCRIHEYGEERGLRFLSMEFVEGLELKRLLKDGALRPADGFAIALQAAEGLHAVHAHRIVHRDLKPTNIMVDRRGVVRLMDFGIAKEAETEAGLTGSGQLMGTPEYMSPEQARGGRVGYASDVYALGCVVFEMFTGRPPFRADTPLNTLYMHVHDPAPLAQSALPPGVEGVLRRPLAKDPADRPTAAAFAEALRQAAAGQGVGAADLPGLVAGVSSGVRSPQAIPTPAEVTSTLGGERRLETGWPSTTVRESRRWRLGCVAFCLAAAAVLVGGVLRSREGAWVPEPVPSPEGPMPTIAMTPFPSPSVSPLAPTPLPTRPPASPPALPRPSPSARVSTGPPPAPPHAAVVTAPPVPTGTLSLVIVPPSEVSVDGASLGTVSLRELSLAAGAHAVRIVHPDYKPLQRKVTIEVGLTERLVVDLGEKGIPRPRSSPP
jgi:serine/threonine-protein kinase